VSRRILLDTCAAVWLTEGNPVSPPSTAALNDIVAGRGTLFISPVVAWEMGMLVSKGRLTLRLDPLSAYRQLRALPNTDAAELTPDVLVGSSFLPGRPPNDPFDRTIIATARQYALTIMTRDRLILDYAASGHVAALAC